MFEVFALPATVKAIATLTVTAAMTSRCAASDVLHDHHLRRSRGLSRWQNRLWLVPVVVLTFAGSLGPLIG